MAFIPVNFRLMLNADPGGQNAAVGVPLTVKRLTDDTVADIFSDPAGTTPIDNPYTTDSAGKHPDVSAAFFVEYGHRYGIYIGATMINEVGGQVDLAAVAFSGQYTDLIGVPNLFSGQYTDLIGAPYPFNTVIKVSSNTLSWGAVNELQASGVFTMPSAAAVSANKFLDIYVADKYTPITATINRSGSDLFDNGDTTDAQLVLVFNTGGSFRVISDGVSVLRV